ncbi:EF-hand calcium-binding domain-containing protein 11 isoform X2 [Lagopus muta]|uniref:EF-hand calcium-binding domain-containing protein 11 isoform X2 n=1 Tax=Lagopus muta TaxID=64668 RepID=UPI00209CBC5C|nr:EF-hand calcium-binding domain-containing protein 11 isoform X2 [Lagopus muta]
MREAVPPSLRPAQRRRCRAAAAMGSLRERCARVFEVCDEGNKGYLNREDFEVAVVMLFGYKLSEVFSGQEASSPSLDLTPSLHIRTPVAQHLLLIKMPTAGHLSIWSMEEQSELRAAYKFQLLFGTSY